MFDGADFALKRTFDIVGSALILIALSPIMILSALAIRLTSRGPVFYSSVRPGIGGRPFACFKFRTMVAGAEGLAAGPRAAQRAERRDLQDPRGSAGHACRALLRWSLDELPQLFNVLRGEMSLGPRPLPQRDYERLEDWHRKRYLVLPGMTGLWQVSGRSELDFDELVRLDFLYLGALVGLPRPDHPAQDDPRGHSGAGRVVSEPCHADNLLDRLTQADTLQVHYDQEMRRERQLLDRRLRLEGGDVLSVGCGRHPGRHLFPRPRFRMTVTRRAAMIADLLAAGELDEGEVGRGGAHLRGPLLRHRALPPRAPPPGLSGPGCSRCSTRPLGC